jgi:hypothetical protein
MCSQHKQGQQVGFQDRQIWFSKIMKITILNLRNPKHFLLSFQEEMFKENVIREIDTQKKNLLKRSSENQNSELSFECKHYT